MKYIVWGDMTAHTVCSAAPGRPFDCPVDPVFCDYTPLFMPPPILMKELRRTIESALTHGKYTPNLLYKQSTAAFLALLYVLLCD